MRMANDFSRPRRMSKSALVVFFVKNLRGNTGLFLLCLALNPGFRDDETSFGQAALMVLAMLAAFLVLAATVAFVNYYYRKYYVEDGNLVFIHGALRKEKTSVPLGKVQSLRTKRGPIYRLLDMRGVSFDTLASASAEIELILDNDDWDALLSRVEAGEDSSEAREEAASPVHEKTMEQKTFKLDVDNANLLKGALCQNHLKGFAVLLAAFSALFHQLQSLGDGAVTYVVDYVDAHSTHLSFSWLAIVALTAILYVVVLLLWTGKVFLRYANMDIQMGERQLFFESGLFSRASSRFSRDKICTLRVKRNFMERWLHCGTISLRQALNATDEKNGRDVRIYGSDHASKFLDWWLGTDDNARQPVISARPGYGLLAYTIRFDLLVSLAAIVVLCAFGLYAWLLVPAFYMLVSLAKGFLAVRHGGITLRNGYLEVRDGKFAEARNYLKYDNVEVVRMTATPFTPRFHRVSLTISTNGTSFTLRSLKASEARAIYELLLCRGCLDEATQSLRPTSPPR